MTRLSGKNLEHLGGQACVWNNMKYCRAHVQKCGISIILAAAD